MDVSHNEFTIQILSAIQMGQDPKAVLEAGKEHLTVCTECRNNIIRLAKEMLGLDFSLIEELSNLADEPEPVSVKIPDPDFTFRGKRIHRVDQTVELSLKLPHSHPSYTRLAPERLASVALSSPPPGKMGPVIQTVPLAGQAGYILQLEMRARGESLELDASVLKEMEIPTQVSLRLSGMGVDHALRGPTHKKFAFKLQEPGLYELEIALLGLNQIPVSVWRVALSLEVSYYLDLKADRKAAHD